VAYRNLKIIAEALQGIRRHVLLLVSDVLTFAGTAHAIALDGLGQDDGGATVVGVRSAMISGIDLVRVMAATIESADVLVRHVGDHGGRFRVLAEEILARVGAAVGLAGLVFAVH